MTEEKSKSETLNNFLKVAQLLKEKVIIFLNSILPESKLYFYNYAYQMFKVPNVNLIGTV